jgi:hypothetical protein
MELCILLSYTECTEGNTIDLIDNMIWYQWDTDNICYQSGSLSAKYLAFK